MKKFYFRGLGKKFTSDIGVKFTIHLIRQRVYNIPERDKAGKETD